MEWTYKCGAALAKSKSSAITILPVPDTIEHLRLQRAPVLIAIIASRAKLERTLDSILISGFETDVLKFTGKKKS